MRGSIVAVALPGAMLLLASALTLSAVSIVDSANSAATPNELLRGADRRVGGSTRPWRMSLASLLAPPLALAVASTIAFVACGEDSGDGGDDGTPTPISNASDLVAITDSFLDDVSDWRAEQLEDSEMLPISVDYRHLVNLFVRDVPSQELPTDVQRAIEDLDSACGDVAFDVRTIAEGNPYWVFTERTLGECIAANDALRSSLEAR